MDMTCAQCGEPIGNHSFSFDDVRYCSQDCMVSVMEDMITSLEERVKDYQKLQRERDGLRSALKVVLAKGHNENCLFCGFKDKVVTLALDREE